MIIYEISAQFLGAVISVALVVAGMTRWIYGFKKEVEEDIEDLEDKLEEDVCKNTEELKNINTQLETINVGILALMENNKYINADKFKNALQSNGYEPKDFYEDLESGEDA